MTSGTQPPQAEPGDNREPLRPTAPEAAHSERPEAATAPRTGATDEFNSQSAPYAEPAPGSAASGTTAGSSAAAPLTNASGLPDPSFGDPAPGARPHAAAPQRFTAPLDGMHPAAPQAFTAPQGPGTPEMAVPQAPAPDRSTWWHPEAASDPWRDPGSRAVIETRPAPHAPPVEPLPVRQASARPALGVVIAVSAVTALIAGVLGSAIGIWATRGGTPLGGTLGADPMTDRDVESVAAVVEEIMPSVVTVMTAGGGNGSGFIVSDEGHILTNHHVVVGSGTEPASQLDVLFSDGDIASAQVIGSDADSDVAVLQIEGGGHPAMVLADSDKVAVGDPVLAVGAPLGLSSTVTEGIVSAIDRPVLTQNNNGEVESVMAAIQTDAAINPGNSGGPLTDIGGQVIGINTAIASTASEGEAGNIGIGFAIPINQAKRIADEIIATGTASHTVIGAELGDSGLGIGVTLSRIVPGSPADDAGLEDGDVVTSFDGHTVTDNTSLIALIRKLAPGTVVTVVYERDGEERSAQVTLEAATD